MSYKISAEVHREVDKKGTMVDSQIGEYEPVEDERWWSVIQLSDTRMHAECHNQRKGSGQQLKSWNRWNKDEKKKVLITYGLCGVASLLSICAP